MEVEKNIVEDLICYNIYGRIGPSLGLEPRGLEFHNFGRGLDGRHNHAFCFFAKNEEYFRKFGCFIMHIWHPEGGRAMDFTIKILFLQRCFARTIVTYDLAVLKNLKM